MSRLWGDYPSNKMEYFVRYEKIQPSPLSFHLFHPPFFCPSEGTIPTVLGFA
jgi:hypothetical protein